MNELTLSIIRAVILFGPSAVQAIASAMDDREVTAADVNALFIDKEPEDYFK